MQKKKVGEAGTSNGSRLEIRSYWKKKPGRQRHKRKKGNRKLEGSIERGNPEMVTTIFCEPRSQAHLSRKMEVGGSARRKMRFLAHAVNSRERRGVKILRGRQRSMKKKRPRKKRGNRGKQTESNGGRITEPIREKTTSGIESRSLQGKHHIAVRGAVLDSLTKRGAPREEGVTLSCRGREKVRSRLAGEQRREMGRGRTVPSAGTDWTSERN